MPATRKLDQAAVDRIVAGRAAGESFRQIAAALDVEVDQSTVSRRVRTDPELRAAISAAQKRAARLARDRERKARAKARRQAGVPRGPRPEQEQDRVGRPAAGNDGGPPLEERMTAADGVRVPDAVGRIVEPVTAPASIAVARGSRTRARRPERKGRPGAWPRVLPALSV